MTKHCECNIVSPCTRFDYIFEFRFFDDEHAFRLRTPHSGRSEPAFHDESGSARNALGRHALHCTLDRRPVIRERTTRSLVRMYNCYFFFHAHQLNPTVIVAKTVTKPELCWKIEKKIFQNVRSIWFPPPTRQSPPGVWVQTLRYNYVYGFHSSLRWRSRPETHTV